MNNLLAETFTTVSQLPEAEQNAIASLILQKISEPRVAPFLISESDIESLEKSYIFRDKTEVIEFIKKYPFLLPVVLEAPAEIRSYFPEQKLLLQVINDPEIPNYIHLLLSIILTDLDPDEAMEREDELRKNWSRGLSHEVRKHFYTILEYNDEF
ncbi:MULTISPECIES: hypothetical protein [Kamptonema]|uniref:hypothetical protein n=1 Tax=Kamptonema TaxID=1501433 RepID=UPI0001DAD1FB|nr:MULTISPECIES: hypothetical protein [Kamptonema]CBN57061.1 hypothetical protein OSCI_3300004 [Kamptonema sp. PCC 6506]